MRAIKCYTKAGQYVDTYKSQREAAAAQGIDYTAINKALKGTTKSAGGLLWFYADINIDLVNFEVKQV